MNVEQQTHVNSSYVLKSDHYKITFQTTNDQIDRMFFHDIDDSIESFSSHSMYNKNINPFHLVEISHLFKEADTFIKDNALSSSQIPDPVLKNR